MRACSVFLLLVFASTALADEADDISRVSVKQIRIEKRWDHPRPTKIPEVPVVFEENVFYAGLPNHPLVTAAEPAYQPMNGCGFGIQNGPRYFNRPIFLKGNMLGTGDRPMFVITRNYAKQWVGKLRFAISRGKQVKWLDEFSSILVEFRAGS